MPIKRFAALYFPVNLFNSEYWVTSSPVNLIAQRNFTKNEYLRRGLVQSSGPYAGDEKMCGGGRSTTSVDAGPSARQ